MTLHVAVDGKPDGPTLVFLHGLGTSGWMWSDQVEALRGGYRCVVVDLPGSGRSAGTPWTSLADAAARVGAAVRAHAWGPANLVGLSLGGYVALRLLADAPDVVASAVASGVTTRPIAASRRERLLMAVAVPLLRLRPVASASARAMRLSGEAAEAYRRDVRALSPATTRAVYDEVLRFAVPEGVADRAGDLLVVAGQREVRAIRDDLATVATRVPGVTAALAPDGRHGWNGEHPRLFSAMVDDWVRERRLTAGLVPVDAADGPRARPRAARTPRDG